MIKKILIIVLIIYSCDIGHFCFIENETGQDVKFKTYPPLEKYFSEDYPPLNKIKIVNQDTFGLYKLSNNTSFKFFGSVGNYISVNTFPFEYMEIIFTNDTIRYTNKQQILNLLKRSRIDNDYYIRIDSSFIVDNITGKNSVLK